MVSFRNNIKEHKWTHSDNVNWCFKKHFNSNTWIEFKENKVYDTYTQISIGHDNNGYAIVILSRDSDGLGTKLTEGRLYWGYNVSDIKWESYSGYWEKKGFCLYYIF